MKNLEEFVSKLIEDKGFNEQDPEVIAQMKTDLLDRVENRINAMIVSKLNPEKLPDFEKILEIGSENEIQEFVKKEIPDIDEKVATELLAFKNIYLG
jgi:hypothetical protein